LMFAGITDTVGAPFLRVFCEGRESETPAPSGFDQVSTAKSSSTRSIAAHPFDKLRAGSCKTRKDGAPSVGMAHAKIIERWATRQLHSHALLEYPPTKRYSGDSFRQAENLERRSRENPRNIDLKQKTALHSREWICQSRAVRRRQSTCPDSLNNRSLLRFRCRCRRYRARIDVELC
jgi:hypothetical protein